MKKLFLQIGMTLIVIGIAIGVTAHLSDFRYSGATIVYIIAIASLFPIWVNHVSIGNRLLGWFFGSAAGLLVFLSTRTLVFGLGKAGSFSLAMGLLGFGIIFGFLVPLWISYWVCRRKTESDLSELPAVYPVLTKELENH